jgi:hypothetical protein
MPPPNLRLVAAHYALDLLAAEEMVRVADALLSAGVYAHPLGELVTIRYPILPEVGPLFASALKELGVPVPTREEAPRTLVETYLRDIAEGACTPAEGLRGFLDEANRDTMSFIAGASGCGDLFRWHYDYEYIKSLVEEGYMDGKGGAESLAALDRRVVDFATAWVREQVRSNIDPAWLAWHGACVLKLAQRIRAESRFEDLPVLADALEEAGCNDREILCHLRGAGTHVRACWVVDLVLGKG